MTPCAHPSCPQEGVHKLANGHTVCSAHLSVTSGAENIVPPSYSERMNEQFLIDEGKRAWADRPLWRKLLGRG